MICGECGNGMTVTVFIVMWSGCYEQDVEWAGTSLDEAKAHVEELLSKEARLSSDNYSIAEMQGSKTLAWHHNQKTGWKRVECTE